MNIGWRQTSRRRKFLKSRTENDSCALLNEGQTELAQLRQDLKDNMALYYPIDQIYKENNMDKFFIQAIFKSLDEIDLEENKHKLSTIKTKINVRYKEN